MGPGVPQTCRGPGCLQDEGCEVFIWAIADLALRPTGNFIDETICRIAKHGLRITDAAAASIYTTLRVDPVDLVNDCPGCPQCRVKRDYIDTNASTYQT